MRLLCDANIVLDVFLRRDPFYSASSQVLNMCESGDIEGYIPVSTITDIYYIIRRATSSKDRAFMAVESIARILQPCSVTDEDLTVALAAHGTDFEDNIIEACAVRNGFDYILTRNEKHFGELGIPTIAPEAVLEKFI